MTRLVAALAAVLALAGTAAAQHCRPAPVIQQPTYSAPRYVAPTYAAPTYAAPAYAPAPVKYENIVIVPAAVYTVPGAPTVQINVYPASQTFVQPVIAPAATLTPEQAGKAQLIPIQVPEGSEVKVIQVPIPVAPQK